MGSGTPYFIPLNEAIEISCKRTIKVETEIISIDKSFQRTLSKSISALTSDPPFDNSAMDGFAVKYQETKNPPNKFNISKTIEAGNKFDNTINTGEAARIRPRHGRSVAP